MAGGVAGRRFIPTRVGNTNCGLGRPALPAVHPHACGEHKTGQLQSSASCGSSPRVWGTPHVPGCYFLCRRFIPTRVGNTRTMPARCRMDSVHPHACGEHAAANGASVIVVGSSPRVWGTLTIRFRQSLKPRFIPTRVGNTLLYWLCSACTAVHPHACGEHLEPDANAIINSGSSPRVWGTLFANTVIITACYSHITNLPMHPPHQP